MKYLIPFLFKSNAYFFTVTFIFSIIAIVLGGIWHIIPYIFILFFFYEWNASLRANKNWLLLDTLPISFFQRYFLRVILPFIFCFSIFSILEVSKQTQPINYFLALEQAFAQTFVFVLSSLLACGLGGYIFWIVLLNLLTFLLTFFHLYIVCLFVFFLLYSYYILSYKRVSKKKFFYFPIIFSAFFLFFGAFIEVHVCKILVSFPVHIIQVYAAEYLIDEKSFLNNNRNYFINIQGKNYSRFEVGNDFEYNDNLLDKIESVIVQGKKCSQSCFKLAHIVQNYPSEWNLDRLSFELNSSDNAKQIYALEILRSSRQIVFFNRVLQLSQSENLDISNRALDILNHWGIHSLYDIPTTKEF